MPSPSSDRADHPANDPTGGPGGRGGILVDRDLEPLLGGAIRAARGAPPIEREQIQPASVDLRLGPTAYRIRAGFLPERVPVDERLHQLSSSSVSLEGDGAVLERGMVYLIPLDEELDLPPDVHGRFNPRSSTGRCDLFTRVLIPEHPRFDETPRGFRGRLWIEVAPLSFPVRLRRGDRLCQLRLQRGLAGLTRDELIDAHARSPLCYDGEEPIDASKLRFDEDGAVAMRIGLTGRDPCGWRGQIFFRLRFFRTLSAPRELYGHGRSGPSYRGQDLTLARPFRCSGSA